MLSDDLMSKYPHAFVIFNSLLLGGGDCVRTGLCWDINDEDEKRVKASDTAGSGNIA